MKLFYSPGSPYARIARIAVRELGLLAETTELLAANRRPDNPVLAFSPVGRVPTLVDGDLVVTETRHVFDYLVLKRGVAGEATSAAIGWADRTLEGQILGFLEGIASWVREERREPSNTSRALIEVEVDRSARCLAFLERQAGLGRLQPFPQFASLALAAGLGLMDFRQLQPGWRRLYPTLGEWFSANEGRASMRETAPG